MCQEKDIFIKTKEVAEIMGKSEYTIQTRHQQLGLIAYKVGRELRFEKSQVYEAIRNSQIPKNRGFGTETLLTPIKLVG